MAVAYAFSDASQKQRTCGISPPICLGTEMVDNSFISAMIFCHVSMSSFFNWSSYPFSRIHKFGRKSLIFIVVGVRYPSMSSNEAIVVRTCLFVVAVILLSNFFVSTINWSVILSRCSPKSLVMVSFMQSCSAIFLFSSGELEFQARKFIDISRNTSFTFEYNWSASSILSAPIIRLSM